MKILTTLCGAALLLCGVTLAQSTADRIMVRFTTPVIVGETTFPAGECEIQVVHGSSDNLVLVMRSHNGPYASVLVQHISDYGPDVAPSHASVILDRRDGVYRLDRILFPDHTGYQVSALE